MNLTELEHLFRYQTTPKTDYVPGDSVDYILVNDRGRVLRSHPVAKLADILPQLDGFVFEGYSDSTPIFIKPEV